MKFQLIRHATMLLDINNRKILIDPIFSEKGTTPAIENVPNQNKNPLVALPVPIESLIDCDAVLITHLHYDHFDEKAAEMLPKEMRIFCQSEDEIRIRNFGFKNVSPINKSVQWGNIKITRTKGEHGHGIIKKRMAPVSGYVLQTQNEPTVYITGDTVWCTPVEKILDEYKPDIIISFCGGARFSKGKTITMDADDISMLCKKLPSAKVIAVHMEAWNHCRLQRNKLLEFAIQNNILDQLYIPKDGENLTF